MRVILHTNLLKLVTDGGGVLPTPAKKRTVGDIAAAANHLFRRVDQSVLTCEEFKAALTAHPDLAISLGLGCRSKKVRWLIHHRPAADTTVRFTCILCRRNKPPRTHCSRSGRLLHDLANLRLTRISDVRRPWNRIMAGIFRLRR